MNLHSIKTLKFLPQISSSPWHTLSIYLLPSILSPVQSAFFMLSMHQFTDLMSAHCFQTSSPFFLFPAAAAQPFHPWFPPSPPHQNSVTLLFIKCFALCTPLKQHTLPNHTQPPKNKAGVFWSGNTCPPSHPLPVLAVPSPPPTHAVPTHHPLYLGTTPLCPAEFLGKTPPSL